jgi:hypothetical protein
VVIVVVLAKHEGLKISALINDRKTLLLVLPQEVCRFLKSYALLSEHKPLKRGVESFNTLREIVLVLPEVFAGENSEEL